AVTEGQPLARPSPGLRQVVRALPKPLAPVAGRPFLAILLEYLASHGFASVVLSVGYKHELIRAEFGVAYAGLRIRYAVEDKPLGTGGAIRLAARQSDEGEVFVMNGDTYVEIEFEAMRAAHRAARARRSAPRRGPRPWRATARWSPRAIASRASPRAEG